MFTGLVEEVGNVVAAETLSDGMRFTIAASTVMHDISVDASIAVNGVCLTVISHTDTTFTVTAVAETLRKTTTGRLGVGSRVNLERAVRLQDRLGGHLVQGHVDATGTVDAITVLDTGWEMWIAFDPTFRKWMIPVGSITVNGVSLTIADLRDDRCKLAIIPHTLEKTMLSDLAVSDPVNLEFDMIAKYVESISTFGRA
ncbi:MAG: riboflavin synthase [Candidatus Kapabacteria bacterium]|nr:riboflavin synthase [Candidatus Kapabacteria bacterium]